MDAIEFIELVLPVGDHNIMGRVLIDFGLEILQLRETKVGVDVELILRGEVHVLILDEAGPNLEDVPIHLDELRTSHPDRILDRIGLDRNGDGDLEPRVNVLELGREPIVSEGVRQLRDILEGVPEEGGITLLLVKHAETGHLVVLDLRECLIKLHGGVLDVDLQIPGQIGGKLEGGVRIDDRGRAPVRPVDVGSRTLGGDTRGALGDQPVPGIVIDDRDLLTTVKHLLNIMRRTTPLVPRTEVRKNAPELLALLVGLGNHVHALDRPKSEPSENRANPSLSDVLEHTGNADAENNSHDERTLWFVCGTFARRECESTNSY